MLLEYLGFFRQPSRDRVEKRILSLIKLAYERVPFYRTLLDAHGLNPHDFRSLEDYVDRFPVTTSAEYRALQQDKGHQWMLDDRLDPRDLIHDRSSGSSGMTISTYVTRREHSHAIAKTVWHLTKAGLRPWHRTLAIRAPLDVVKRDFVLQELGIFRRYTVDVAANPNDLINLIEREGIDAIYGAKQTIMLLAEQYVRTGRTPPQIELLVPGAERVDPFSRNYLQDVFRPRRYGEYYGATETGIIGTMHGGDYEVNYHSCFFRLVNQVSEGELTKGSLVVTSLYMESQPMLMVQLGDEVTVRNYDQLLDLKSSIVSIDGRDNDYLVLADDSRITGAELYSALQYFPFMRQFQFIQESLEYCRVLIRLTDTTQKNRREIEETLEALLTHRIKYGIEYVAEIPFDPRSKTKILISRIPTQFQAANQ